MYAVVEFEIDNSISPVQKSWISADQKTCYYPPISQFKKIILKATMPDTNRWTLFNIKMKTEIDDSTFSHSSILANFKIQKVEKSNDSNLDVSQNVQIKEEHLEEEI
ncbi:hypothetical protein PVAND_002245 [Polypedilum vanderplanki]|uniref:Uncharacterized protein n=1 Tax=Polypedilum vanderplanki TaxID=319348 RepID=A0A9J6BQR9_POLVA|nr:hypothetical protein PVAND_002245 [Polypedilum vanderplanki]